MRRADLRKPPTNTNGRTPRYPLPAVRRQIWEAACSLTVDGDARDVQAVLSNRFKLSKGVIARTLITEGIRHERAAAIFRNGLLNLLEMVRQTDDETAAEFSEVA